MTLAEFSNGFDILVSSYRRFKDFDNKEMLDSIEFDEYEKSFYLTKSQEELIHSYYDGKNIYGDSFESTEELRRQLDILVETKVYQIDEAIQSTAVNSNSVFFTLPNNLDFIVMEQITFADTSLGCYNGTTVKVQPIKHDEYSNIKNNPFKGPNKYKAIRLDSGNNVVEIISQYDFNQYLIRYIRKPSPIILETLPNGLTIDGENEATECELNPILHNNILERAVLMALRAKGINTEK
jgi:hypothetical protein